MKTIFLTTLTILLINNQLFAAAPTPDQRAKAALLLANIEVVKANSPTISIMDCNCHGDKSKCTCGKDCNCIICACNCKGDINKCSCPRLECKCTKCESPKDQIDDYWRDSEDRVFEWRYTDPKDNQPINYDESRKIYWRLNKKEVKYNFPLQFANNPFQFAMNCRGGS